MTDESPAELRVLALRCRSAARVLQSLSSDQRADILRRVADGLLSSASAILAASADDVAAATASSTAPALLARLSLTPAKLEALAAGVRSVAALPDPLGKPLTRTRLASGLELTKVSSPLGVLLVIFESRPDALPQIASLCVKAGDGLILKGGKEAARSCAALHAVVEAACVAVDPELAGLVAMVTSRGAVDDLLSLHDVIDLVIPRGSNALVAHITQHTRIPVLGHADGVCHVFVHESADAAKATAVVLDAKTDYPAACNAMETLLLHRPIAAGQVGAQLLDALRGAGVTLYGGPVAAQLLGLPPAADLHTEYGSLACCVEVVDSTSAAVEHIHAHGSGHTECIVASDESAIAYFLHNVDSACVFANASTRFADGARFGLGAEVGIATGRLHARGPVGIEGLLTTRWLLAGDGHVVAKDKGVVYTHEALPLASPPL